MKQPFYHSSIRNLIVVFSTLFNEVQIERGNGEIKAIPLQYTDKEKFIIKIENHDDIESGKIKVEDVLPKMGFQFIGMQYDHSRKTNTVQRLNANAKDNYSYNRVPYNLQFKLYIATRKINDSLKIIEQIVPYFTPEITLKVKDIDGLDIITEIPVILNNPDFMLSNGDANFEERRTVYWELDFTMKAYLYPEIHNYRSLIKREFINFHTLDMGIIEET